jgi:lipopolysaccharide export system permease protein
MSNKQTVQARQGRTAGFGRFGLTVLDRTIFRELLPPFCFGMLAFLCILLGLETVSELIPLMANENFTLGEISRIFVCQLPRMIALTLPLSMLLAVVLGYNRLSGDGEVTAMLAGGISFFRIEFVGVAFALGAAVSTYCLTEIVVPHAETSAELIALAAKSRSAVVRNVIIRIPSHGTIRSVVVVESFDYSKALMTGPTIIESEDGEPAVVYKAKEGVWREGNVELHDVRFIAGRLAGTTTNIKTLDPAYEWPGPRDIAGRRRKPQEMTRQQLREHVARTWEEVQRERRAGRDDHALALRWRDLQIQYHVRIALPVSCIAFALVGTPLGIRPRRASSSMGFGLAVLIVFGYYIFFSLINLLGQRGVLSPFATAWIANAIAIALGLGLSIEKSR